jgi:hypothetical protein
MRRLLLLAALVLVVPSTGAAAVDAERAATNRPLLGTSWNLPRFQAQTAQRSQIHSMFLGWNQGLTWGSPFAQLFATLAAPIPMIHIGTAADARQTRAAITPAGIAQGGGDNYLIALNEAIANYGGTVYLRFLAEMNNPGTLYSPRDRRGRSRGATHSPQQYIRAFRRAYILLHGGSAEQLNARLSAAGLPGVSRALPVNPAPRLTVIWNPVAGISLAQEFFPGNAYVDMVGNDIYASIRGVASYRANEQLYARHSSKPYSLPEWGLQGIDDETFIRRICNFLKSRSRTRLAAYFEAKPGSRFDLGNKPRGRAEYRRCVTPIGGTASRGPALPPGPPTQEMMALTVDPAEGAAPLPVTFTTTVNLGNRPIARWELAFGDGRVQQGTGIPPRTIPYTYTANGVFNAALIVYLAPPFTGTAIRLITQAQVRVGQNSGEILRIIPNVSTGRAPLAVSFRTIVNVPQPVVRWELVHGDGTSRGGEGRPPSFLGKTYQRAGLYRAVLIVYLQPQFQGTVVRLLTYADIRVT